MYKVQFLCGPPSFLDGHKNMILLTYCKYDKKHYTSVYDQHFYGGRRGGGWGGGSSERCLKWGGGGSLRDLSKNILKQGVGKGESCS